MNNSKPAARKLQIETIPLTYDEWLGKDGEGLIEVMYRSMNEAHDHIIRSMGIPANLINDPTEAT